MAEKMSLRTTAENVAWRRCIRDVACSSVVRYSRHRGCIDQKSSATDSQQPCAMENQWQRWRWAKLTSSVLSLVDWWWWSREFDSHHCASHSRTCSFINKQFNLVGGKHTMLCTVPCSCTLCGIWLTESVISRCCICGRMFGKFRSCSASTDEESNLQ